MRLHEIQEVVAVVIVRKSRQRVTLNDAIFIRFKTL